MADIKILENDFISMVVHEETGTLHHTFLRTETGVNMRAALDAGVDALRDYGLCKWLSDDRKKSAVTPEDNNWSLTDWGPRAVKAGWQYWALVVPEDIGGKADYSGLVQVFFDLGVRMMVFTDVAEAQEWLNQF